MKRQELKAVIVKNGYTQKDVARKLGMTPKTFYLKMKKGVFGTDEVMSMVNLLHIENPGAIFLSDE